MRHAERRRGTSTDGDEGDVAPIDADEDGVEGGGGYDAGGGSAGLAFALLALTSSRRRRRD